MLRPIAPPPSTAGFVQFEAHSPTVAPPRQSVPWPTENEHAELRRSNPATGPKWRIRTPEEEYIASLEAKLAKLTSGANTDSGYASSSRTTLSPSSLTAQQPELEGPDDLDDLDGGEGTRLPAQEDEDASEGRALLACSPASQPAYSPPRSRLFVIPPTPAHHERRAPGDEATEDDTDGEPVDNTALAPSADADATPTARRISFSSSVRISGGIRKKSRSSRALPSDLFSPGASTSTAPSTERTRLLSTGGTTPPTASYLPRTSSPSSSAIHARTTSASSMYLHHSGYSSTATSAVPSRSSSPCSSIYAPLQPPSQTCPSPMVARPPIKKPRTLSFREFLSGKRDAGHEPDRVYKQLIDEQWRKKSQGAPRPRTRKEQQHHLQQQQQQQAQGVEKSVWEWIVELLSVGATSAGSRGGLSYANPRSVPPRTRRPSSSSEDEEALRRPPRGRGRKVRRTPSTLSFTSVSDDADDESDGASPGMPSPAPARTQPKPKSETDVRFGPAPQRWANAEWWLWRGRVAVQTVTATVRSCFQHEELEPEAGAYHQV